MRLSTKFVLLIAGSIIVPVLAMLLIFLSNFVASSGETVPSELPKLKRTLRELDGQSIDLPTLPDLIRKASPHAAVFILDSENRIIDSSTQSDVLMDFLNTGSETVYTFFTAGVADPSGEHYSVVVGLPAPRGLDSFERYRVFVVPASFLVFITIMSVLIIRSINASISRLEEATRRISEGNLDFRLEAKGSDSIASLTRSFDAMRNRVREETAARSRFLMAVSHDLKTPLSSITGYLDAIQDGMAENPEILDKYLSVIRDKTGLLVSRIRQLIDFVKLETGQWQRSREDVLLYPFLDEASTIFGTEAGARGYALETAIEIDRDLEISMDSDLAFRVLENLMNNAFRYAEPDSRIEFHAFQGNDRITVRICNRGESIPEEDIPFVFEPFYRGTKARRETGFGLGLSVVKSVVSSHGWDIDVSSRDDKTCFTITILLPNGANR